MFTSGHSRFPVQHGKNTLLCALFLLCLFIGTAQAGTNLLADSLCTGDSWWVSFETGDDQKPACDDYGLYIPYEAGQSPILYNANAVSYEAGKTYTMTVRLVADAGTWRISPALTGTGELEYTTLSGGETREALPWFTYETIVFTVIADAGARPCVHFEGGTFGRVGWIMIEEGADVTGEWSAAPEDSASPTLNYGGLGYYSTINPELLQKFVTPTPSVISTIQPEIIISIDPNRFVFVTPTPTVKPITIR